MLYKNYMFLVGGKNDTRETHTSEYHNDMCFFHNTVTPQNPSLHHPKVPFLGLVGEKIAQVATCFEKASILTESGKVS